MAARSHIPSDSKNLQHEAPAFFPENKQSNPHITRHKRAGNMSGATSSPASPREANDVAYVEFESGARVTRKPVIRLFTRCAERQVIDLRDSSSEEGDMDTDVAPRARSVWSLPTSPDRETVDSSARTPTASPKRQRSAPSSAPRANKTPPLRGAPCSTNVRAAESLCEHGPEQ